MSNPIHPTASVHPAARIAQNVEIGPFCVVEEDVMIGAGTRILSHAVLRRFTRIGDRNTIGEGAVIGGEPQDVKFARERSFVEIGDDNLIREYVTIHRASGEEAITRVGSRNFLMVGVHIAHNCEIGDDNIFANGAALAGHITVDDHVFLSNNVGAHQFVRMGRYAMVGGKSKIVQDVLPFCITDGNPPYVRGLNTVGLRRAGFSAEARAALKQAFRLLLRSGLPLAESLAAMEAMGDPNVNYFVAFARNSKRGFPRSVRRDIRASERE